SPVRRRHQLGVDLRLGHVRKRSPPASGWPETADKNRAGGRCLPALRVSTTRQGGKPVVNLHVSPSAAGRLAAIAVIVAAAAAPAFAQLDPPASPEPPQPNYELWLDEPGEGQACFFERYAYSGERFCANAGEVANYLGSGWSSEISSIQVGPGTIVELCIDWNLENCTTFDAAALELAPE